MRDMNNIIALSMSGITSPLRFTGPLDTDLRKMSTNLVPFTNAHFLISGFAPLTASASQRYRKTSVLDLAQQMMYEDNVTVRCDPLSPGDQREGILRARFLASYALWRGKSMKTKEVDQVIFDLQKSHSRFDKFFPDWIPNSIASNITQVPHRDQGDCVTFVSNNTAVHEVFDRIMSNWDNMYRPKSYLHVFEQDGISTQDMLESRNILQYISDEYCELAQWEDKIFEDLGGGDPFERPVIRDVAIENDEQQRIAQELQELLDGNMDISIVGGRRP